MNTNLQFYFAVSKMIKLLVTAVFILSLGVYCFKSEIEMVRIIGIFEIVLGVTTFSIALKSLFNKKAQLIFDVNGIIDNRILKNHIGWHQIQKIELATINYQKVLKLSINNTFDNNNFKWLYKKTVKLKLNQNPKIVLLNLDQIKIDYASLNDYLALKRPDFIKND